MLEVREITTGLQFPEGPVAMPDGSVLVVEIARRCVTRVQPDGTKTIVATPGAGRTGWRSVPTANATCATTAASSSLTMRATGCARRCRRGTIRAAASSGSISPPARSRSCTGARCTRSCAGRTTSCSTRMAASTSPISARCAARLGPGAVYYARADGSLLREVAFPLVTPNGIGLSPDGNTLYVAETEAARLWAWPILEPGVLGKEPWPSPHGGRLVADPGGRYQRFDLLAVEADGNICVATLIHGGITVISPDGAAIEHVPMPDLYTTNICFGGPDLRTAYITLSNSGRLVAVDWPRPGLPLHHLNQ